jgi:uncharacterized damage-inducible protein DinB
MSLESLKQIFNRDLDKLKEELAAYNNETNLWLLAGDIKNTGGNLVLHLCGNLQHFVGAILGQSGFVRKRDDEFGLKGLSKAELSDQIEATKNAVNTALTGLTTEDLNKPFPVNVFGKEMTTDFFLIHLATHLSYHLGQINYHRRLLDNK